MVGAASPKGESSAGVFASAPPSSGALLLEQPLERPVTRATQTLAKLPRTKTGKTAPKARGVRLIARAKYRVVATRGTL
jgi:hypothetical protein